MIVQRVHLLHNRRVSSAPSAGKIPTRNAPSAHLPAFFPLLHLLQVHINMYTYTLLASCATIVLLLLKKFCMYLHSLVFLIAYRL